MPDYTADGVKKLVQDNNHTRLDHHDCSICGVIVRYLFTDAGENVTFDASCNCSTYSAEPRDSSYKEIAEWLAMQKTDETRDKILSRLT